MIDYEMVKKFFADKLATDFAGHGRFESAFYHTIKMVHDSVAEENAERIAVLEKDIKTLCAALSTTSAGNAELLAEADNLKMVIKDIEIELTDTLLQMADDDRAIQRQRDELLAAAKNLRDVKGRYHSEQAFKALVEAIAKAEAGA